MHRPLLISMFVVGSSLAAAMAYGGDKSECNAALIQDSVGYRDDYAAQLAMAEMVTESNFEQMKKSGAVGVVYKGIPIKGTYEDFSEKRREYRRQFELEFTEQQSRGYFSRFLSDNATAGYLACLKSKSDGVHVWATNASRDYLKVTISWNPGANGAPAILEPSTPVGGTFIDKLHTEWKPEYARSYTVERDCGTEFRFNVNMAGKEDSIVVPPYVELAPRVETRILETATVKKYSSVGSGSAKRSAIVCVDADEEGGWEIDPKSVKRTYTVKPFDRRGIGVHENTDLQITTSNTSQVCIRAVAYPQAAEAQAGVAGYVTVREKRTIYANTAVCGN